MRLDDRTAIPGTSPTVYIGHRVYRAACGELRASRAYTAEYCVDGKQRQIPLGTSNKEAAIRKVWEMLPHFRDDKIARRGVTMAEVFERWLANRRDQGVSRKTQQKYDYGWKRLRDWLGKDGQTSVRAFVEPEYHRYRRHLKESCKLSPKSIYTELTIVKSALKWADRVGLIAENPVAAIPLRKTERTPQPVFTPDQLATLLAHAEPVQRGLIALMGLAGLRVGEAVALKWGAIQWARGKGHDIIVVREGGSEGTTKSKKTRRVPISPDLKPYLMNAKGPRNPDSLIFCARPSRKHPNGDGPVNPRRMLVSLKRLCRRCGFVDPDQYKCHSLRHTFVSLCAAQGVPEAYVLEWVGHSSSDIVRHYFHQFDHVAADQIRKIRLTDDRADAS